MSEQEKDELKKKVIEVLKGLKVHEAETILNEAIIKVRVYSVVQ